MLPVAPVLPINQRHSVNTAFINLIISTDRLTICIIRNVYLVVVLASFASLVEVCRPQ